MELYLDTANVAEVERLARIFPIAGVTTNPSIIAASKESIWEVLPRLQKAIGDEGILFAQTMSRDAQGMVKEAKHLRDAIPGIVVKIPVTSEGLAAIKMLKKEGITTLGTAVYSAAQGLLAALAGAKYVAPYVNRVDAGAVTAFVRFRSCKRCWKCMRQKAWCWLPALKHHVRRWIVCWLDVNPSHCP